MLMVVNQIKLCFLSFKYAIMREMLNKTSFIMNVIFMVLNDACFIVQWLVLYSIKSDIGGYEIKDVFILWGIAAGTYGIAHLLFAEAFELSNKILYGKLDSFLVQPKNVLLSVITSKSNPSSLGDIIYSYIMFAIVVQKFDLKLLALYTFLNLLGGFMITSITIIVGSLSFWFQKAEAANDVMMHFVTAFSTYPEGIFKGLARVILFTVVPIGFINYIPVNIMREFSFANLGAVVGVAILLISFAFIIFNLGLKKYSSSNLMMTKY